MESETGLSTEELEVINGVAGKFYGRMKWDSRWEFEDVRQELALFWLKRKQDSWQKPEAWKGAMGHCLILRLKDLQKKSCSIHRRTNGQIESFDHLVEQGFDLPATAQEASLADFLNLLNPEERRICELLLEGQTKKEVAHSLARSRPFIDQRLQHVRHLAEEFL